MGVVKKIKTGLSSAKNLTKDLVESRKWPIRPQTLNFEITSICDSKCIHCPRHLMDRKMRPMNFELFKKMIDEAAELKIPELCPNGYGEILTVKDIDKYFDYISSKEHKFKIIINTNGFRLSEEKIELFIKHKVDLLNICIDGATRETAETVRVNLKFDEIEKNIYRLLEIRKLRNIDYPKIRAGFIVIPPNEHEKDDFVKKWESVADFVGVTDFSSRAGSLNEKFGFRDDTGAPACVLPFKALNIWADGNAVICCEDWNGETSIGNLNQQSIQEIWQGDKMTDIRRKHIAGQGGKIKICSDCNSWQKPSVGARLKSG